MLDPALVADALTLTLAPALPYLVNGDLAAAQQVGEAIGSLGWKKTQEIWRRLASKVAERAAAAEAAADVAADPQDSDARAAFRRQLKKILTEDELLAAELTRLLEAGGGIGGEDRRRRVRELLEFEGKVRWEGDLDELRGRRKGA